MLGKLLLGTLAVACIAEHESLFRCRNCGSSNCRSEQIRDNLTKYTCQKCGRWWYKNR